MYVTLKIVFLIGRIRVLLFIFKYYCYINIYITLLHITCFGGLIRIMHYDCAYMFTKHTDLLQWFDINCHCYFDNNHCDRERQRYAKPRNIQLIFLVRYENDKVVCKIKCPINPLPIKGEFTVASLNAIIKFLDKKKWKLKQKLPVCLVKWNLYQAHKGNLASLWVLL